MTYLGKIAKEIRKLADQVESIEKTSKIQVMKAILNDILDIEKDIDCIIAGKYGAIDHNFNLARLFESSKTLLSNLGRVFLEAANINENEKELMENKKHLEDIKQSIFRILRKLDSYYKAHLREEFYSHGIKARDIKDRMNRLKQGIARLKTFQLQIEKRLQRKNYE